MYIAQALSSRQSNEVCHVPAMRQGIREKVAGQKTRALLSRDRSSWPQPPIYTSSFFYSYFRGFYVRPRSIRSSIRRFLTKKKKIKKLLLHPLDRFSLRLLLLPFSLALLVLFLNSSSLARVFPTVNLHHSRVEETVKIDIETNRCRTHRADLLFQFSPEGEKKKRRRKRNNIYSIVRDVCKFFRFVRLCTYIYSKRFYIYVCVYIHIYKTRSKRMLIMDCDRERI